MSRQPRWTTFTIVALALTGCSTFERDWRQEISQQHPADALLGAWSGTWTSEVNGHTGDLRCIVTRGDEGQYLAAFHATFWNVMQFEYDLTLTIGEQRDGRWHFSSEEELGWLAGGLYRYEGHADAETFYSTYRSKKDHGYFEMARPPTGQEKTDKVSARQDSWVTD